MFERESRLFQLARSVCSIGDDALSGGGGGDALSGGGDSAPAGDTGGGDAPDAGGGDAQDAAGAEAVDGAPVDGAVDDGTAPPVDGTEPAPPVQAQNQQLTPEYIEQMVQERLQQAMAQQAPPPYMAQLIEAQQAQNQRFNDLMAQAAQERQRAAVEATRPRPPGPGASVEEFLDYQRKDMAWQQGQTTQRMEQMFRSHTQRLEQMVQQQAQQLEQARLQANVESHKARMQAEVAQLARQQGMQWVQKGGAQAVLRTIHQAMVEANPNITLAQTAQMLASEFGLAAPSQQAQNAARRGQSVEALQQQRAAVQQRKGALPAATSAKSNGQPKDRANSVRKAIAAGAKFPPEMLELYGLNGNN